MKLCDYGCGQEGKYKQTSGKWCCSKSYQTCPSIRNKNSKANIGIKQKSPIKIQKNKEILCSYGCGKLAEFFFPSANKYCCSKSYNSCIISRKVMSQHLKNRIVSKETRKKMSKSRIGKKDTIETRLKKSIARQGNKNPMFGKKHPNSTTVKYLKEKYPFLLVVEELKENKNGEIQGHCKNHNCKNSKEKGGWFTLTYYQLKSRKDHVCNPDGNGGSYFYCSQHCKDTCPLYHVHGDPYKDNNLPYTAAEKEVWRQVVLERENGLCEYCGEPAEHVHHIFPQKLEPFFALDPDYGVACCKKHHYEYGHKDECSTGNLSKIVCSVESQKFLNQKAELLHNG